uniref:Outer membrane lipoprotein-sorting protein n=1 Tax=Solibacter usitatus (strain Ellin6076) TaxID=234267 RepID=Q01QL9_SOLUE
MNRVARKPPDVLGIALILTSVLLTASAAWGQAPQGQTMEPPANLAKLVAHRESETEAERNEYTYRQSVTIDELDAKGGARGQYRETRDVIFSPEKDRTEQLIGHPDNGLKYLILTDEDFADIRNIQPLVLTEGRLWNYETKFRGEENMDGVDCWVLQVRPRQILQGQRFFDGMMWVDKKEYNIVRMEGQAVPQIRSTKTENLFPKFTTIRKPLDGKHWFPIYTYADDTLQFRTGPQRIRLRIAYSNYKKFGAESTLIVK